MGAFNTVEILEKCPGCNEEVNLEVQFKYGDTYQHHYRIGDVITWGGNDIGKPACTRVVVSGYEVCPMCEAELEYEVWLEKDRIVAVQPATGTYDFVSISRGYIVIEG